MIHSKEVIMKGSDYYQRYGLLSYFVAVALAAIWG